MEKLLTISRLHDGDLLAVLEDYARTIHDDESRVIFFLSFFSLHAVNIEDRIEDARLDRRTIISFPLPGKSETREGRRERERERGKIAMRAREDDKAERRLRNRLECRSAPPSPARRFLLCCRQPATFSPRASHFWFYLPAFTPMHRPALCATVIVPTLPRLPRPPFFALPFSAIRYLPSSSAAYFYPL